MDIKDLKDLKNWDIVVWGDWRTHGGTKKGEYIPEEGKHEICISGGNGLYWLRMEDFTKAINCFLDDLFIIERLELETGERIHKGFFYYHIALAQRNSYLQKKYLAKARDEDMLTYGEKAKDFPSFAQMLPDWDYGKEQNDF